MIENGISPVRLSALFGSKLEAYSFFVKTMQDRHCLEALHSVDSCVCCGYQPGRPTELKWRAAIYNLQTGPIDLLMVLIGHITYRQVMVPMKTHHHICVKCSRRVNARSVMLKLLDAILFFCFIAALFPAVGLTVFAVGLLWYAPDTFRVFGPAAVVAVFILALIVWAMAQARLWAVPAPLREIGRSSFELVSANEVPGGRIANQIGCNPPSWKGWTPNRL